MSPEITGLVLLDMLVVLGQFPLNSQSLLPVLEEPEEFPTRKDHVLPAFLSIAKILALISG